MHVGAFQSTLSGIISRRGGTRTKGGSSRIRKHKKIQTRRDIGCLYEFCIINGNKRCCVHRADHNECKFDNTTKATRVPYLVPASGNVQPKSAGGNAKNDRRRSQKFGITL